MIRHLVLAHWELVAHIRPNPIMRIPILLPYIWMFFIGLVIFVADTLFHQTKKGYRLRPLYIVLGSTFTSIILGSAFYLIKADQPFEHVIRQNFPPYRAWEEREAIQFIAPQLGVLAGEIKDIENEEQWQLIDFNGELWVVNVAEAEFSEALTPSVGEKVGMRGELIERGLFKAIQVNNWEDAKTQMEKRLKRAQEMRLGLPPKQTRLIKIPME